MIEGAEIRLGQLNEPAELSAVLAYVGGLIQI